MAARPLNAALTKREYEVLVLLTEGLTHKQIGHRLGIQHSTVRSHLVKLYVKLDVQTAAAAVAAAMGDAYTVSVKPAEVRSEGAPAFTSENPFLAAYLHHWENAGFPVPGLVDLDYDVPERERDAMTAALAAHLAYRRS